MVINPNAPIAPAAMRFSHTTARSLNRSRKWPEMNASNIHQSMAPAKIPVTRKSVRVQCRCSPNPNMASTARNDRTVVGLVRVSRNVDAASEPLDELSEGSEEHTSELQSLRHLV